MDKREKEIRLIDASDERQYMLKEDYEVYEKQGAPVGAMAFHYHDFYEIIYILEGEFSSLVQDKIYTLRRGDFLLIDRNVLHKYHFVESRHDTSRRIILWITDAMLKKIGDGDELDGCFEKNNARVCHFPIYYEELLRGFLMKLAMAQILGDETDSLRKVMDRGYLSLFFSYMNTLCKRREYLYAGEDAQDYPVVHKVEEYIQKHLDESVTVDDIACYIHMSKFYLIRKFKELTGMTIHTFLVNKRLMKACDDMRAGSSVTQAWQDAGFADYSSFLRNFQKAYGISPRDFKGLDE